MKRSRMPSPTPIRLTTIEALWMILSIGLLLSQITSTKIGTTTASAFVFPNSVLSSSSDSSQFHRRHGTARPRPGLDSHEQMGIKAAANGDDQATPMERMSRDLSLEENSNIHSLQRRNLLRTLTGVASAVAVGISGPSQARAGEVGARITRAVTTSDLGISVRTSVVKGAQLADKIDGQWEKFSDTYGLGSERSKRKETQKVIPDPLPLNTNAAQKILDVSDEVFLKLMPSLSRQNLSSRIGRIAQSTRASFERAGVTFSVEPNAAVDDLLVFETAPQFNFVVYAHFKAYSELILEKGNSINFPSFLAEFERNVGQRLIESLQLVDSRNTSSATQPQQEPGDVLKSQILAGLEQADLVSRRLRELGLVSNVDRNSVESSEDLLDFVDDALGELVITLTIDGDVTLQSQMLLQEQGYRLYPNFNRFVATEIFREAILDKEKQDLIRDSIHKVSAIDYYFDTNYNSDPDKFEVKQVLLNISIE